MCVGKQCQQEAGLSCCICFPDSRQHMCTAKLSAREASRPDATCRACSSSQLHTIYVAHLQHYCSALKFKAMLTTQQMTSHQHAIYKQGSDPMAHQLDEVLFLLWHAVNSVALRLEVLQHLVDAAKHIQVGCCANIALVRWETEDCDGHLLLGDLLLGEAATQDMSKVGIQSVLMYCTSAAYLQLNAEAIHADAHTQEKKRNSVCLLPKSILLGGTDLCRMLTCSRGHMHHVRAGEGKE